MERETHIPQQIDAGTSLRGIAVKTRPVLPQPVSGQTKRPAEPAAAQSPSASAFRAQEAERRRISRELHDEVGQGLMTLRLYLGALVEAANPELRSQAQDALTSLDMTIDGLRRIISRLSPRPLQELGLLGAIRREAHFVSRQKGMKAHLELPKSLRHLDAEVETAVYRSVQEGLHNVAKHSAARTFRIRLELSEHVLNLEIDDDGSGLSVKARNSSRTFGVAGMRERIEELGGRLQIYTQKTGGTSLRIEVPVATGALINNEPAKAS